MKYNTILTIKCKKMPKLPHNNNNIEKFIEHGLFASRWLMAPFYIGLAFSLALLLLIFLRELYHLSWNIFTASSGDAILGILALVDLSLSGNLLLIVIFAGYENFVSKIDVGEHKDNFEWRGRIDFSALKLKLVSSMVAISGIHLLTIFMKIHNTPENEIKWLVIIHIVFIFSGLFLALMDYIVACGKKGK